METKSLKAKRKAFIKAEVNGYGYQEHAYQNSLNDAKLEEYRNAARKAAGIFADAAEARIKEIEDELFILKREQSAADRESYNKRIFMDRHDRDQMHGIEEADQKYSDKYYKRKYALQDKRIDIKNKKLNDLLDSLKSRKEAA